MNKKIGWLTYLSGKDPRYADGVLVLYESLQRTNTKFDFYCMCVGVPKKIRDKLANYGINIIIKKEYPFPEHFMNNAEEKLEYWAGALNKLQIFSLYTTFDKFVYLDSDMIVFKNIDHLFKKQDMTASEDAFWITGDINHKNFNAGLMVIEPNKEKWLALERFFNTQFSQRKLKKAFPNGGVVHDQLILNLFFNNWKEITSAHLLFTYNYFAVFANDYKWSIDFEDIFIAHYTTKNKPFMKEVYDLYNTERQPRTLKEKLYVEYIKLLNEIKVKSE